MLVAEGELRGLIGPNEVDILWERHILNSAGVALAIGDQDGIIVDVGSGAGFPGVVVACMKPQSRVYLVDSMHRRTQWLEYVVQKCGITNVEVINGRSEDIIANELVQPADFVTARAVAPLKKLLPWTMGYLKSGGELVALKGEKVYTEIEDAKYKVRKYSDTSAQVVKVDLIEGVDPVLVCKVRRK
ncbi:ribosomal RNA small subunit methyltransferase G [Actinomycetota bacterium]|nr:ribosomal RNA small subunit methyltransferase G [Actinomycetota bacterium]